MSFEENIEDETEDEPKFKDREISKRDKPWLTQNVIILLILLVGGFVLYLQNSGGEEKIEEIPVERKAKPVNHVIDFHDSNQDTKEQAAPVEMVSAHEPQDHHYKKSTQQQQHEPSDEFDMFQDYENSGSRNDKSQNNDTSYQNRDPDDQPPMTFDPNSYMKTAMESLNQQGDPIQKEKTLNKRLETDNQDVMVAKFQDNLDKKILQGKIIKAVIDVSISTDLPGMIRAFTKHDTYSQDGLRLIIPSGSWIIGQYRGGMDLGKKRLFVIWNRIITPKNSDNKAIDIVLNSPSIGDLGMSGMQMQIDTHFLERFGSSFMLSILNAGVSTAAGLFSDGNQSSVQDVQGEYEPFGRNGIRAVIENKTDWVCHAWREYKYFCS